MGALKKLGKQSVQFQNPPVIISSACVAGPWEAQGPLGKTFDKVFYDPYCGEDTWEKAEQRMLLTAVQKSLEKANLKESDIDFFLCGDLLNQITSSNFIAAVLGIPFLGLYGACSTMCQGLALGAMIIDGGFADRVVVATSSHYSTAERQFRFPTELGVQRPMTAQWTVTGAGAVVLAGVGSGPAITCATVGEVIDLGMSDPMDMGSVMAPAAAATVAGHFLDTGRQPEYYDLIISGDLGVYGKRLAKDLVKNKGYEIDDRLEDCGVLIFKNSQDMHAGGSGCACSAVVICGYLMGQLKSGILRKVLGVGTGALHSPCTVQQGGTIPGIAHAVALEAQ